MIDGPLISQAGTYRGILLVDIHTGKLLVDDALQDVYCSAILKPGERGAEIMGFIQTDIGQASELSVTVWAILSITGFQAPAAKAEIKLQCDQMLTERHGTMAKPTVTIPPLLEEAPLDSSVPRIYERMTTVDGLRDDHAANLADLFITGVWHYRSEKLSHELVVLDCQHTNKRPENNRYWIIQRFRLGATRSGSRSGVLSEWFKYGV
jgi:hypothetical protein